MNYLLRAMETPDQITLVFFPRHQNTLFHFSEYLDQALHLNVIVRAMDTTLKFAEGGCLRFCTASCMDDVNKYKGMKCDHLHIDRIWDNQVYFALKAHLHRPVYKNGMGGVK